jgi:hypothetical protein
MLHITCCEREKKGEKNQTIIGDNPTTVNYHVPFYSLHRRGHKLPRAILQFT